MTRRLSAREMALLASLRLLAAMTMQSGCMCDPCIGTVTECKRMIDLLEGRIAGGADNAMVLVGILGTWYGRN